MFPMIPSVFMSAVFLNAVCVVSIELVHGSLLLQQIAGRGEGHVDFEGFRKIYDEIMTVKEVSVMIKIWKLMEHGWNVA